MERKGVVKGGVNGRGVLSPWHPRTVAALGLAAAFPATAWANAGIPLGMYSFAWSVLFLIPVVLAEAWVLRSDLGLSYLRAVATTGPSNVLSTIAGSAAAVVGTFPLMATEGAFSDVLTLVLFVPLFYLSRRIEFSYSRWSLKRVDEAALRKSVHRANLVTYAMLVIFVVARFFKSWYAKGYIVWW